MKVFGRHGGHVLLVVIAISSMANGTSPVDQAAKSHLSSAAPDNASVVYDRHADRHTFTLFMREGGWCWFQDPRAIIHADHLLIGSVQGNGRGSALIGIYDLVKQKRLSTFVAHDDFNRDDHNSPVFHPRPDGSVLAMYARHGKEKIHYYRISDPRDDTRWGEEQRIEYSKFLGGSRDNVTYTNLLPLSAERKLYCFFRGLHYNPCFVTSENDGESWANPKHFIQSEVQGRQRPYARYAGNGVDQIHVSFTDAHPRNFGNSVYYARFERGNFYRADGSLIKNLDRDGPLRPSEAELVFEGGGGRTDGSHGQSAAKSAWTSSIACDDQGRPTIAYTYYLSNTDHRYRIASWDGQRWIDRQVAFGGTCLYERESSYTGLIAIDPLDPKVVVISTDVDPETGAGSGSHEIYRSRIDLRDQGSSVKWQAVTRNSTVDNLRPLIVRDDDRRIILWNRGEFRSYTNYQLDTVGLIEKPNE